MNSIFKKLVTGTAVLALSMTAFASASLATDSSTEITGTSLPTLSPVVTSSFNSITLDGKTQVVTAKINTFDVTDATGTGNGWNVTVSATQFTQAAGANPLATGALSLAAPVVNEKELGSSNFANITKSTVGLIDVVTPLTLLTALAGEGMGTYTVSDIPMTLTLLPKEVYAGTYTSTITTTIESGPGL
ncbi:WxL domain-containing protein [Paenisporosarcina antarctica]|uniref:WxL domain-containing protein n=1 Tax=Paenisporosarcina antarctica TaxID=417367 RepID=A0A4P6ZZN4_9BACL|nr:WxL domain-containing protein [Paenisporosarcina antarctica]QBP41962.1 hypothetical protein E2636_12740 [Paenisporosarcina antarctica]